MVVVYELCKISSNICSHIINALGTWKQPGKVKEIRSTGKFLCYKVQPLLKVHLLFVMDQSITPVALRMGLK
jgi:hypothetical protein